MAKSETVSADGIACPRCGEPTEVREHAAITEKELRRPFYYARWYRCVNDLCKTTLIMREEHKVWNNDGQGDILRRTDMIQRQLAFPEITEEDGPPPWE